MNEIPEQPDDPVRTTTRVRPAMSLSPPPNENVYLFIVQPAFWGRNIKKNNFHQKFCLEDVIFLHNKSFNQS